MGRCTRAHSFTTKMAVVIYYAYYETLYFSLFNSVLVFMIDQEVKKL